MLELLSENEINPEDAYRNFAATGARASDYESTITVLEELAKRLDAAKPVISARIRRSVAFLKRSR